MSGNIKTCTVLVGGQRSNSFFRDVQSVTAAIDELEGAFRKQVGSYLRKVSAETAATYLASFSHPNPQATNRHLTTLYELFDKVEMLESIHAMLVSGFAEVPKAQPVVSRVQGLILYAKKRVDAALAALTKVVARHQPEYFAKCCQAVYKHLERHYKTSCTALDTISLVRVLTKPDGSVRGTQFSTYIRLLDLTDGSGYAHDRYHVVLTCVVDLYGKYSMNVSLQPTMLLPGKFPSGDGFSNAKEGCTLALSRMAEEGFSLLGGNNG